MKNDLQILAEARAKALLESYKTQDYASLASRLTSLKPVDLSVEIFSEKPRLAVATWGQKEPDSRLAILVETRKSWRWFPGIHSVSADGFFIEKSGTIIPMKKKDLWNHGY
ncbi:MAG: hypothetical protein PHR77_15210 [Kiritimatiellae bacterium]|nr:hypothetical protein [Kiritimatiellia bacterium]MDD5523451.1 hypothetical protein [Kiritimatiellia bacterium]